MISSRIKYVTLSHSYLIRGLVYERIDIGNLKYCLQMQQNLPPEEWIVLMQQIVDGTEACFLFLTFLTTET